MNTVFTVEESNLISIFINDSKAEVISDISNTIPHLDDEEMIELSLRVVEKLKVMSDEEFANLEIDAAELAE